MGLLYLSMKKRATSEDGKYNDSRGGREIRYWLRCGDCGDDEDDDQVAKTQRAFFWVLGRYSPKIGIRQRAISPVKFSLIRARRNSFYRPRASVASR